MNKENKLVRITIDLPIDLQKKIKTIAILQHKSMRKLVIESIEKTLKEANKTTKQSLLSLEL